MKAVNKILNNIEIDIDTDELYDNEVSFDDFISAVKNNKYIKQLTFLLKNSDQALYVVLDRLNEWVEVLDPDYDANIAAVIISLYLAGRSEQAKYLAGTLSDNVIFYWSNVISGKVLADKLI